MSKYNKEGLKFLEDNPDCILCGRPAMQVHHTKGRIGKNFLDTKTWAALCFECHYELHFKNPALKKILAQKMEVSRLLMKTQAMME